MRKPTTNLVDADYVLKGYVKSSLIREVKLIEISYFNELAHEIYRECRSFPYFSYEIKKFRPSHFLDLSRSEILKYCGFLIYWKFLI